MAEVKFLLVQLLVQGDAFTKTAFSNLGEDCEKSKGFGKHHNSNSHYWNTTTAKANDVANMISSEDAKKQSQNRQMLFMILTDIRCLARQSLPFRGSWSSKCGSECVSNIHQMHLQRCEVDERLTMIRRWRNAKEIEWVQEQMNSPVLKFKMRLLW